MDLFQHAAKAPAAPEDEALEGTVVRIVYQARDGAFTVARLGVAGEAEPVTVVGALLGVPTGSRLRLRGRFENDPRFGRQLRVSSYTEIAPETLEGIRRYLGSGLVKGIGRKFAGRIVDKFGLRTLEVLDAEPDRIADVPGIGRARAEAVKQAWAGRREIRDVMVFLQGHGVSPAYAVRIYKRYGAAAVGAVRANPYCLASDVWGIGFLSADRLAASLGIGKDSDRRVDAGVKHELGEAAAKGHVFQPRPRLVEDAAARLEVDGPLVEAALARLSQAGEIIVEATSGDEAIYDVALHRAERAAAAGLGRLLASAGPAPPINVDRALASYEREARITLAPQQAEAVRRALREPVLVITGGPGVGKTTIVRGIVAILAGSGLRIGLAAPTGRAAKRLGEAVGRPAATLHRLLEWRPAGGRFGRNKSCPLDVDLLVVDEASMLDVRLAADLLAALADGARLLLVGDVDQLPSVGPGTVLADVIASGRVPTVRLTQIFRQAARSLIVTNAHRIHDGQAPDLGRAPEAGAVDTRDFFFLEEGDPARAALVIRDLVTTRLPRRYGLRPGDIQVLCPMHRGDLGAGNLNQLLQAALTRADGELKTGSRLFRTGDRVMQLRNDYDKDVWNGDTGEIVAVDEAERELAVRFDDREISYTADELDELTLAYAATVHKSQGSEYPAVVVPVHTQHYVMLQRNLLYTAVTRGKRLVVLVGSHKALALAVRNAESAARCSRLAAHLLPAT